MLALFVDAATAVMDVLGEAGVYTPTVPGPILTLRVLVERDVISPVQGIETGLSERRTVLTLKTADLYGHTPVLGDTVTVGAETWKVLALEQDDGYLSRLKVRKVP